MSGATVQPVIHIKTERDARRNITEIGVLIHNANEIMKPAPAFYTTHVCPKKPQLDTESLSTKIKHQNGCGNRSDEKICEKMLKENFPFLSWQFKQLDSTWDERRAQFGFMLDTLAEAKRIQLKQRMIAGGGMVYCQCPRHHRHILAWKRDNLRCAGWDVVETFLIDTDICWDSKRYLMEVVRGNIKF